MVTDGPVKGSLITGHCFILIDTHVEQKSGSSGRKSTTSQKFDRCTFGMFGDSPLACAVGVGTRFAVGFCASPSVSRGSPTTGSGVGESASRPEECSWEAEDCCGGTTTRARSSGYTSGSNTTEYMCQIKIANVARIAS